MSSPAIRGLFGIPGTGGFYLRNPELIAPVRYGGTGTDSFSLYQPPREMPGGRFETGTHNYPGLAALAAGGVNYIASIGGVNAVAEKAERQTAFLIRELREEPNVTVYNESPSLPPIVSFNIRGGWRTTTWASSSPVSTGSSPARGGCTVRLSCIG